MPALKAQTSWSCGRGQEFVEVDEATAAEVTDAVDAPAEDAPALPLPPFLMNLRNGRAGQ